MNPTDSAYDPYSPATVSSLLRGSGLWLSRNRGQNYLIDRNIAEKIVSLVPEGMPVLEIGSGLGALTVRLAEAHSVTAVEIDGGIVELFKGLFSHSNLNLIDGDFLKFDIESLPETGYAFVSNLPYSVAGEMIRRFIDSSKLITGVVMIQREFYERITAKTGSENYGALAVIARTFLDAKLEFDVGRKCFFPEPSVASSVVLLAKKNPGLSQEAFKTFVSECFRSRRKTLANNLKASGRDPALATGMGIDVSRRPEEIAPEVWAELFAKYG